MNQQENFFEKLQAENEAMQNLSRITPPYARPSRDYFKTLLSYTFSQQHYSDLETKAKCESFSNFTFTRITVNRHSCLKNPNDLEPILLRQMKVNNIHEGKYLECYVLSRPYLVEGGAVHYLITDTEEKELEFLSIYNLNFDLRVKNAEDTRQILTQGSRLIIKEPYLKFVSVKGDFVLRVDSPTDVVFLPSKINLDFSELMKLGKENFLKKKFLLALRFFTEAVNTTAPDNSCDMPRALLNRSAVFLQLNNYNAAYHDAAKSVSLEASEKGYFRMGRAAYSMRQFQLSLENFKKCLELNPSNKEACLELKQAQARLEEAKSGVYDFSVWQDKDEADIADYKSPDIEVIEIKKGYKGVVAVRPIKKGTLLVVSKSVSTVFDKELDKKNFYLSINQVSKRSCKPAAVQNFARVIKKMQGNPELTKQIYQLYAGPSYSRSKKIDESIVDVSRLDSIMQFNTFETHKITDLAWDKKNSGNNALFVFPSFFNHSCVPNLNQIFIADVTLISANRDIKENEELFISYRGERFRERKKILLDGWGFECKCELCHLDQNDKFLDTRESIIQHHTIKIRNGVLKTQKTFSPSFLKHLKDTVSEDINKIRSAYKLRSDPQVNLTIPLKTLSDLYALEQDYCHAASICEEIYEINKTRDWMIAFYALVDAFILYEKAFNKRKDWCYRRANELFFTGAQIYFKYVFLSVYKQKNFK